MVDCGTGASRASPVPCRKTGQPMRSPHRGPMVTGPGNCGPGASPVPCRKTGQPMRSPHRGPMVTGPGNCGTGASPVPSRETGQPTRSPHNCPTVTAPGNCRTGASPVPSWETGQPMRSPHNCPMVRHQEIVGRAHRLSCPGRLGTTDAVAPQLPHASESEFNSQADSWICSHSKTAPSNRTR